MAPRETPREHVIPVIVEFEDVDSYRIAHHSRLIAYLERARVHFFHHLGLDLHRGKVAPVLARMEMRFSKPALFFDHLDVAVFVREVTDFSLVLGYRIRRQGETLATAGTTLAFSHLEQQRIMPLPDDFQAALAAWLRGEPTSSAEPSP